MIRGPVRRQQVIRAALAMLLSLAVPVALLATPHAARADDGTIAARKHFEKAEKLFGLGRFAEARVEYEAAYEAKPLPEFLYNIGQCHRNLGDFQSAIFSFRRYLDLKPDASNRKAVEKLIADLEEELAASERPDPIVPPNDPPGGEPHDDGKRPIYKKWWFWTGIAAVAAAGTGATVALTRGGSSSIPSSDLGNVDFSR